MDISYSAASIDDNDQMTISVTGDVSQIDEMAAL